MVLESLMRNRLSAISHILGGFGPLLRHSSSERPCSGLLISTLTDSLAFRSPRGRWRKRSMVEEISASFCKYFVKYEGNWLKIASGPLKTCTARKYHFVQGLNDCFVCLRVWRMADDLYFAYSSSPVNNGCYMKSSLKLIRMPMLGKPMLKFFEPAQRSVPFIGDVAASIDFGGWLRVGRYGPKRQNHEHEKSGFLHEYYSASALTTIKAQNRQL